MELYERKLIGGILSGAVQPSAVEIDPADLEELGEALAICRQLESERIPITPEVLAIRLADSDGFYSQSDFEAMAKNSTSASVVFEATDKIKGKALKTFLHTELARVTSDETKSGSDILDSLKEIVSKADKNYRTAENNFVMLADIVPKLKAVYDDLYSGISYSIPSGFEILDGEILDGFSKGDLHIVVGFTGQGKSALALNCARAQAESGVFVGVVSREMSDIENTIRLQSSKQTIPRWQIRKGMFDRTYEDLTKGLERLSTLPIAFDVRTDDIESLRVQTARQVEQYEMKILYVDYLQLMRSSKNKTRADEVAAVSRGLKLIAMENNIPVVALCQFNRGAVGASTFDLMSHLKESSGIEQDASTILYVQVEKTEEQKEWRPARVQVLKNRNGATFRPVEFQYHGPTFTFHTEKPNGAY